MRPKSLSNGGLILKSRTVNLWSVALEFAFAYSSAVTVTQQRHRFMGNTGFRLNINKYNIRNITLKKSEILETDILELIREQRSSLL